MPELHIRVWVEAGMTSEAISWLAKALYILAAAMLAVLSLVLIFGAAWAMLRTIGSSEPALISEGLRGVGLIVIGIAVFDVAKYLIEEEVMRSRELRSSREVRQSLTKFMTIIVIATSLEGLVAVFQVGADRLQLLLYPVLLLATSVLALVGLGVFQWLSRSSEASQLARAEEHKVQREAKSKQHEKQS